MEFRNEEPDEAGGSQSVRAQRELRALILAGALPPGARIAEVTLVELIGVSRTPIRTALLRLEQEGLVQALSGGGYAVRVFSERDVSDAIELRGTLEGLAARLAAERGVAQELLVQANAVLDRIDAALRRSVLDDETFKQYVEANAEFHTMLHRLAGSDVLARELDRVVRLPFASPSGFVVQQAESPQARDMLIVAQDQHRQVLDAISRRESVRAEAIMREHSRIAQRNLRNTFKRPESSAAGSGPLFTNAAAATHSATSAELPAAPRKRGRPRRIPAA